MTEPAREHNGDQPLRVSTLEFFFDLVALAAAAVGVTLSVAAEMVLLILIVAAALVAERRAGRTDERAAVDSVKA